MRAPQTTTRTATTRPGSLPAPRHLCSGSARCPVHNRRLCACRLPARGPAAPAWLLGALAPAHASWRRPCIAWVRGKPSRSPLMTAHAAGCQQELRSQGGPGAVEAWQPLVARLVQATAHFQAACREALQPGTPDQPPDVRLVQSASASGAVYIVGRSTVFARPGSPWLRRCAPCPCHLAPFSPHCTSGRLLAACALVCRCPGPVSTVAAACAQASSAWLRPGSSWRGSTNSCPPTAVGGRCRSRFPRRS